MVPMQLNKNQIEILKLFSREMEEEDMLAIKKLIMKYLGEKITRMADKVWEEKGWTDDDVDRMLNEHERTPYNPKN